MVIANLRRLLAERATVRKLVSNSGWLLADQIIRLGLGALLSIWIARELGPSQLGLYSYCTALVALAAPIAVWGMDSLLVRDLVRMPADSSAILFNAGVMRAFAGLISLTAAVLLALLIRAGDSEVTRLTAIAAAGALFQSITVLEFWFQAKLRVWQVVLARNVAFLAAATLRVWCLLTGGDLVWLCLAAVLDAGTFGIVLWQIYRRQSDTGQVRAHLDWLLVRKYFREGRILVLTGLLIAVCIRVDRVIIGSLLGNHAVGIYSVVVQLCEIFYVVPTAIMAALYPSFVKSFHSDPLSYERRLIQLMRVFFVAGLVVACACQWLAEPLVGLMFSQNYQAVIPVLKVYVFMLPLVFMGVAFSHRYVLLENTRYSLIGVAVGGALMIGIDILLIPHFGLIGAAVVAIVAQIVPTLIVALFFDRSIARIVLSAVMLRPTLGR